MSRAVVINGECLVKVRFGAHIEHIFDPLGEEIESEGVFYELGLSEDQIRITPRFVHKDIRVDDFGDEVPAEVMAKLAEITITMKLIHYDPSILDVCIAESLGGNAILGTEMTGAGALMGQNVIPGGEGNHFIGLSLMSPVLNKPNFFPTSYLAVRPVEIPLGTERTVVLCNWRAIPYGRPGLDGSEIQSSGTRLWLPVSSDV